MRLRWIVSFGDKEVGDDCMAEGGVYMQVVLWFWLWWLFAVLYLVLSYHTTELEETAMCQSAEVQDTAL